MIEEITVSKSALQDVLRENRAKHHEVFEAALEGYRKAALAALDDLTAKVKAGRLPHLTVGLPIPKDHTIDYDRVLRMLDMHQSDTLKLDEHTFAQYVEDDWGWRREFLSTSNSYAAATVQQTYGDTE